MIRIDQLNGQVPNSLNLVADAVVAIFDYVIKSLHERAEDIFIVDLSS